MLERGRAIVELGDSLVKFRATMRESEAVFDAALHQTFVDLAKRAFTLRQVAGVTFHPKWHFMLDLAHEAGSAGNPSYYSTFLDESYNGQLARVCKVCSALTWHKRVLMNFRWAFSTVRPVSHLVGGIRD